MCYLYSSTYFCGVNGRTCLTKQCTDTLSNASCDEGEHQTNIRYDCSAVENLDVCEPTFRRTTSPRSGIVHNVHCADAGDQQRTTGPGSGIVPHVHCADAGDQQRTTRPRSGIVHHVHCADAGDQQRTTRPRSGIVHHVHCADAGDQ